MPSLRHEFMSPGLDIRHGYQASHFDRDQLRIEPPGDDPQPAHGDRQRKTARAGAARIEIDDAVFLTDLGLVAMSIDHGGKAGGFGVEIDVRQNMTHIDSMPAERYHLADGKRLGPAAVIHIAANRDHGRDGAQEAENFSPPHIAGMDDKVRAVQRLDRRGAQQPMRVGDHPDRGIRFKLGDLRVVGQFEILDSTAAKRIELIIGPQAGEIGQSIRHPEESRDRRDVPYVIIREAMLA